MRKVLQSETWTLSRGDQCWEVQGEKYQEEIACDKRRWWWRWWWYFTEMLSDAEIVETRWLCCQKLFLDVRGNPSRKDEDRWLVAWYCSCGLESCREECWN
jgi:hypothetical protein